jgi:aspartate-semialdehyde dehydrogenase
VARSCCNPNCTIAVLVTALAPLHERFGLEEVFVATMQAVSGAGYPGVASLDVLGNIVPFIKSEEEKIEAEAGEAPRSHERRSRRARQAALVGDVPRVPVVDGPCEAVSVRLRGSPSPEVVREALASWRSEPQLRALPTAPPKPIVLHSQRIGRNRGLDVERDRGMSVHVGRVRACTLLGIKFFALGHNLERGAAGASVLNAELCHARGMLAP